MSELRPRTKRFAVAIFRFCDTLPDESSVQLIRRQVMRSVSSIGADDRAACHARSRAEFLSKMSVAEEEADETEYWLELLDELDHAPEATLRKLRDEAHQITSMIIASIKNSPTEVVEISSDGRRHSSLRLPNSPLDIILEASSYGAPQGDGGGGARPTVPRRRHS